MVQAVITLMNNEVREEAASSLFHLLCCELLIIVSAETKLVNVCIPVCSSDSSTEKPLE